jgi:DNA-binding transcriptional ArsR family regulator
MNNNVDSVARLFKALSFEKRLRILNYVICNPGKTVSEISISLRLPFPTTSRSLTILADSGLIIGKRTNNYITYKAHAGATHVYNIFILSMVKRAYEMDTEETTYKKKSATGFLVGDYSVLRSYINL